MIVPPFVGPDVIARATAIAADKGYVRVRARGARFGRSLRTDSRRVDLEAAS
jgi:hypothetical protein